jgi:hypothetical protein
MRFPKLVEILFLPIKIIVMILVVIPKTFLLFIQKIYVY